MRRRFFVEKFEVGRALIEGEAAHHLGRVLRAQTGQLYELSDGERVWLGRVENVGRERIGFELIEELPAFQPKLEVSLLLAVVKFDAFEWALEKATELGVSRIVPLAAARSDKPLLYAAAKRAERWKKILMEASQQSRRLRVPVLEEIAEPQTAFAKFMDGIRLLFSEQTEAPSLRTILSRAVLNEKHKWDDFTKATFAIGPEGGWTDAEFATARDTGFCEASLGRLILRTETAVIAALVSLNYALGE